MTREELIIYLHRIGSAAYTQAYEEKVMAHDAEQRQQIEQQAQEIARLREALRELHALAKGECPSLLNEDSGGDAKLALEIEGLLKEEHP